MIIRPFRIVVLGALLLLAACSHRPELPLIPKQQPKPAPTQPSAIKVEVSTGGPIVLVTSSAEFRLLPNGYLQAFLLKDGKKLSLDEPLVGAPSDSDYLVVEGKDIHFTLDFQEAQVLEAVGKMGVGKRVEISARPLGPSGTYLERVLTLEVYDNFPNLLLTQVTYKNTGSKSIALGRSVDQRHRFSARLMRAQAQPWDLWSFQGSTRDSGKEHVVRITKNFVRKNPSGAQLKRSDAGAVPVAAFWTSQVGEAIGLADPVEPRPTIPVKVAADGRVETRIEFAANQTLGPGETCSSPRNFLSVYASDTSEPTQQWSAALPKEISDTNLQ